MTTLLAIILGSTLILVVGKRSEKEFNQRCHELMAQMFTDNEQKIKEGKYHV